MSWLIGIGAALGMFIGSIFGFSGTPATPAIQAAGAQQTQQQNAQQPQLAVQTQVSAQISTHSDSAPQPSGSSIDALMQQIGCSDMSSCISACMRQGMTRACQELQSSISAQMSQGRTSSAYTAGTPGGPSNNQGNGVAFVGNNTPTSAASLPACPSGNAFFDTSPIALAQLANIEPLGHMNGEHILPNQADHVYVNAKSTDATSVYAPGNATLLAVAKTTGIAGADKGAGSVKLFFSPCKSVMFVFQMSTLSPQIERALANVQPSNAQAGATVSNVMYAPLDIPLTSGEELGTIVGLDGQGGGVDFAAADVRTSPLQFIDQSEATGMLADSYQHTVCPLDYFTPSVRSTLYAELNIKNAGANGVPACGSVMQDKAGTAQGNWYDKSSAAPSYQGIDESALLAIAHWNLNPALGVVSVGTDLIPTRWLGTQIVFTPKHSGLINREPSEITPDGTVYCFEGPAGAGGEGDESHVDVELTDASTLKIDYAPGTCAAAPTLSAGAITYVR